MTTTRATKVQNVRGDSSAVHLRETLTGTEVRALRGHVNMVYKAAFDPSGKMLTTSDGEGMLRLWHADTGSLTAELRGHDDAARIAFSPDGSSFVTVGRGAAYSSTTASPAGR